MPSTKANQKKSEMLGMSHGCAAAQLRKSIMFLLVQRVGMDVCFQCKEKITDVAQFSIEHKFPWQQSPTPKEMFFDLENIAFSHYICNVRAGTKPNKKYSSVLEGRRIRAKKGQAYRNKKRDLWRISQRAKGLPYT